jgi:hypothetical protein
LIGPEKIFGWRFPYSLKGIWHHLNCISRICFKYITTSTYNKATEKNHGPSSVPGFSNSSGTGAAIKASQAAVAAPLPRSRRFLGTFPAPV